MVNQPKLILTQSLTHCSSMYAAVARPHFHATGSAGDGPTVGGDYPTVLLLGHDSRRQQVKEVMLALVLKGPMPHEYPLSTNLPSPVGPHPFLHPWADCPLLNVDTFTLTPLGFLLSFKPSQSLGLFQLDFIIMNPEVETRTGPSASS